MKLYCLKARYVDSFGGRRLDTMCDTYQEKSHDAFVQLGSDYSIGSPKDENLMGDLAKKVSEKYPIEEKDEIITINGSSSFPVREIEGMGVFFFPLETSELETFTRHMKSYKSECDPLDTTKANSIV